MFSSLFPSADGVEPPETDGIFQPVPRFAAELLHEHFQTADADAIDTFGGLLGIIQLLFGCLDSLAAAIAVGVLAVAAAVARWLGSVTVALAVRLAGRAGLAVQLVVDRLLCQPEDLADAIVKSFGVLDKARIELDFEVHACTAGAILGRDGAGPGRRIRPQMAVPWPLRAGRRLKQSPWRPYRTARFATAA